MRPNTHGLRVRTCLAWRAFAVALALSAYVPLATGQSAPWIDTTPAWQGVAISGPDAVGQVITAPAQVSQLTAFEFFNVLPATPFSGGVFIWDDAIGSVVGAPLVVASGIPPQNPSNPFFPTIPGSRIRFELPSPVLLLPQQKYLVYAYSIPPHQTVTSWLLTVNSYSGGLAKQIFPPNGTVTGPWTTVTALGPGDDIWAVRVFLASPAVADVPAMSALSIAASSALVAIFALTALRRKRSRRLR